ncbi:MAG: DUF4157 domain-containing protein, partial [Methylobacter sp.]|nr:DUF4157 domain-containing protein [Methylobacter sp.]
DGVNQYRYNNAGRLVEVVNSLGRTWYYYNGLGQRSGKWRSRPSDFAGDANHDGRINMIDYRRTAVIANGSYALDLAADCNRDNAVTLADADCVKDKYGQVATDTQAFTHYVYDPADHLIGEYLQLGTPIQETVYLGDTPILIMMPDANATALYTIDTDHLDTPRVIKNSTGAIVWRWDQSEPFGITQPNSNPSGQGAFTYNLRFPGQYYDQETGLHYNMERYYHPGLGRYLQSDPIGLAGGINTYTYVNNNPLKYVDPLGLRPLSDSEKSYLSPYIPARELNNADINVGEMPFFAPDWANGITLGNDIYFRDPSQTFATPEDLGLLGHELVHVGQYEDGMTWFSYAWESMGGYSNNPYELEAYKLQRQITRELKAKYGASCPSK